MLTQALVEHSPSREPVGMTKQPRGCFRKKAFECCSKLAGGFEHMLITRGKPLRNNWSPRAVLSSATPPNLQQVRTLTKIRIDWAINKNCPMLLQSTPRAQEPSPLASEPILQKRRRKHRVCWWFLQSRRSCTLGNHEWLDYIYIYIYIYVASVDPPHDCGGVLWTCSKVDIISHIDHKLRI